GLWISTGARSKNTQFLNNIVKVEALSDQLNVWDYRWQMAVTTVDINGGRNPADAALPPPVTLLEGNTFSSNVEFVSFGSSYGTGIQNVLFKNNHFQKIDHHTANFEPYTISYWDWGSEMNMMVDNTAEGFDIATTPLIFGETFSELTVANTFDLTLVDSQGDPVANQPLELEVEGDWTWWKLAEWLPDGTEPAQAPDGGKYTISGVTDAQGAVQVELKEVYHVLRVLGIQERVDYRRATLSVAGYLPATAALADLRQDGQVTLVAETGDPGGPALGAPGSFWTQALSADGVYLRWWTDQAVDGTKVYRAASPDGPFALVGTVVDEFYHIDAGLPAGTTFYYKLAHFKGALTGAYTEVLDETTHAAWAMPSGFRVAEWGADGACLRWWTGQPVDGTKVYRATSPDGPFALVATVTGQDYYADTGLALGKTFYYKAAHFKGADAGAFTETLTWTTAAVWAMPSGFRIAEWGADGAYLRWWTGQPVDGTKVYRATSPDGPFTLVATVTGQDYYADTGLAPGTTFYYKAAHFKGADAGAFTETLTRTT
ncbi:MAG: hypothetical protein LBD51_09180, partial [Bifidobacteriaceae bacterium]|nr:hypothetical protein [Bifidobacteriaceae bacterium]